MRWYRPLVRVAPFCLVIRRDNSVHTLCGGRWSASSSEESCEDPPNEERCGRCAAVHARRQDVQARVERAKERAAAHLEEFERSLCSDGDGP